VQSIADNEWLINSIVPILASLHAIGRRDLAPLVEEIADPDLRESELVGRIYEKYRRDFQNLALQERRLRSHKKSDIAELEALRTPQKEKQAELARLRKAELEHAFKIGDNCVKAKKPFTPEYYGFDFSRDEYFHYVPAKSIRISDSAEGFGLRYRPQGLSRVQKGPGASSN
jgi:hypothetical protein